jgi:hypothetical protein
MPPRGSFCAGWQTFAHQKCVLCVFVKIKSTTVKFNANDENVKAQSTTITSVCNIGKEQPLQSSPNVLHVKLKTITMRQQLGILIYKCLKLHLALLRR